MNGEMHVVLADFSVHDRLWVVDLEEKSFTPISRSTNPKDKLLERGFVKKFVIGGPLGVLKWRGGSLLITKGSLIPLASPELSLRGKWTALCTHVFVQFGNRRKHFIDVTPLDAVVRITDPTWDQPDQEASDVVSALERWVEHGKRGHSTPVRECS